MRATRSLLSPGAGSAYLDMKSSSIAAAVLACCVFASFIAAQDEISKISGRVLSTQGVPVAGALVYATGVTTTTDGNGAFSLSVKAESEDLELLVKASGFALFHTPLSLESLHTEIIARLEPPRVAIVRVVGEDGKPIRLATVHGRIPFAAAYSALERADFLATTDQDGIAVIRDIPADGALIAEVRPPGMVPGQSATLVPVPEPAPADLARAAETIVVSPGRGLRIAVENDAGRPVAGAAVSLLPLVEPRLDFGGNASRDTTRGSIRSATTDARGRRRVRSPARQSRDVRGARRGHADPAPRRRGRERRGEADPREAATGSRASRDRRPVARVASRARPRSPPARGCPSSS